MKEREKRNEVVVDDVEAKIDGHGDKRAIIEELLGLIDGIRAELYDDRVEAAVIDLEILKKKVMSLMHVIDPGDQEIHHPT